MIEYNSEFLEKLKKLCLEFDSRAGGYPEHPYEGFALYYFALHPEAECNPVYNSIDPDFDEGGKEYLKELKEMKRHD
jgi:hypothetical protein